MILTLCAFFCAIAILYCLIFLAIVLFQNKLAFPSRRSLSETAECLFGPGQHHDIFVEVPGGTTNIRYFPGAPDARVYIYCGGHGNTMADSIWLTEIFQSLSVGLALCDYGGYGRSTGQSSERRCYEDVRAVWRFLTNKCHIEPRSIVLYGYSMGAGIAMQLATEELCACLVLDSAFKSFPEVVQKRARFFPVRRLIRVRFDNISKIPYVKSPVLVLHGKDDATVPFHHGRALFDLAPSPKRMVVLNTNHDKSQADWEMAVKMHVPAFLREVEKQPREVESTP